MKTIKTAVSLPAETYHKAEKLRKKLNKSRSEMIADALTQMMRRIEIEEKEARDNAAHAKNPYTPKEIEEAVAMSQAALEQYDDDWSEEYNATR
ncbi:MAG: ribbon-helix-helix protein, CopG family [Elusimicrobiota bacterium]